MFAQQTGEILSPLPTDAVQKSKKAVAGQAPAFKATLQNRSPAIHLAIGVPQHIGAVAVDVGEVAGRQAHYLVDELIVAPTLGHALARVLNQIGKHFWIPILDRLRRSG
jgi:hypothetical protein